MEGDKKSDNAGNLNVVQVRRYLNEMRQRWHASTPQKPFFANACLDSEPSLTLSEFAFRFVQSHHQQRDKRNVPPDQQPRPEKL